MLRKINKTKQVIKKRERQTQHKLIEGNEIHVFKFKIQSKNDPNLTTLFLPNGVLRAKPELYLPLFAPHSPKKPRKKEIYRYQNRPTKIREARCRASAIVASDCPSHSDGCLSPAAARTAAQCLVVLSWPARHVKLVLVF